MEIQAGLWCINSPVKPWGCSSSTVQVQVKILSWAEGLGELPGKQGLIRDLFPPWDPHFLVYDGLLSSLSVGSC